MKEEWRDVEDYKGLYQVSNLGRVKRILFINNIITKKQEKILRMNISKKNRCYVDLYKNNKRKAVTVHRLVAKAFLPNPHNYPQINHIDGNPRNNYISNLEWCDASYNCKHAYHNGLSSLQEYNNAKKKPIIRNDGVIYDCAYAASRDIGAKVCNIRDCLKGRNKTCRGYSFRYLEFGNTGTGNL